MMNHTGFHRAILGGAAGQDAPRWAFDVLGEIARGSRSVVAMRHPLGFVCIPVDRTGDQGVCVHVWSDSLPSARPTTSTMHAHSWDLISHVLYGSVRNELIDVTDAPDDPAYRVFEIRSGGDVDEVRETPRLVRCEISAAELNRQGDTYTLRAGVFHATAVQGEAATVALGSGRPGTMDLSLGGIDTRTHRVGRQRCDRDETAAAARVVTERLASIRTLDQEDRWDP
ncbi:MAG: hypothetical protein M3R63_23890 [Actinomycetota bacterium]|nr:hypothetical protein [Actinomycetota bacterium]